ncbi:MAG TPA: plastocyanin/azurin family copper-binding protein [Flavisolibacter sp.]
MKKVLVITLVAASVFTMSCNSGNNTKETTKEEKTSQPSNVSNTVELTANDQLKYSTTELHVKANEPVKLTLKNIGTMPKESMGHNFILLKDGTDLAAFAAQAVSAPDHIPASNPAIIAHTKLLGPGESDTIEFTVPAGSYTYICSFPGHYMTMTGVLMAE